MEEVERLVVLSSFEAVNLMAMLDEAGIECSMVDHSLNKVPMGGIVLPEADVMIRTSDHDRAIEILQQYSQRSKKSMAWECPECDSEDVTEEVITQPHGPKWNLWAAICLYLVQLPVALFFPESFFPNVFIVMLAPNLVSIYFLIEYLRPHKVTQFTCRSCGHKFTK